MNPIQPQQPTITITSLIQAAHRAIDKESDPKARWHYRKYLNRLIKRKHRRTPSRDHQSIRRVMHKVWPRPRVLMVQKDKKKES